MERLLENLRLFVASHMFGACLRLPDFGLSKVEFHQRTTVQSMHVVTDLVT